MNEKTKEFRQKVTDMFIHALEEKAADWKKPWFTTYHANAVTNNTYNGINQLYLSLVSAQKGYTDPRWATFRQAQVQGWKIRKGAKGYTVEYWFPFDRKLKKSLTWEQYKAYDDIQKMNVVIRPVYKYVFNAKEIEGIPELSNTINNDIKPIDIIEKISQNMGVPIIHYEGNSAYYNITNDDIHLPELQKFKTQASYSSTALHELSHATGAKHRLHREFGQGQTYAYEELVAEITATYMAGNLSFTYDDSEMENHKAYVQSWISQLKEKPEVLISALKEANTACDYLEYNADLITQKEYFSRTVYLILETTKQIQTEIQQNGYPLDNNIKQMVQNICEAAPGIKTLRDLNIAYKDNNSNFLTEAQQAIKQLGDTLKSLEITKLQAPLPE